ncbi:MAG: hypothetical protein ACTSXT_13800 [Candidatus Helarchaeota archaeon]
MPDLNKSEPNFEFADIKKLQASMTEVLEMNKNLVTEVGTLKGQIKDLSELNIKVQEQAKFKKFGLALGLKEEDELFKSEEPIEDKLWALTEKAVKTIEEIKGNLRQKPVGSLEGDDEDPDKVLTLNEAMDKAEKEKPDLKGQDLVKYAKATYPKSFDVKGQYTNIVNFLAKVGD